MRRDCTQEIDLPKARRKILNILGSMPQAVQAIPGSAPGLLLMTALDSVLPWPLRQTAAINPKQGNFGLPHRPCNSPEPIHQGRIPQTSRPYPANLHPLLSQTELAAA